MAAQLKKMCFPHLGILINHNQNEARDRQWFIISVQCLPGKQGLLGGLDLDKESNQTVVNRLSSIQRINSEDPSGLHNSEQLPPELWLSVHCGMRLGV